MEKAEVVSDHNTKRSEKPEQNQVSDKPDSTKDQLEVGKADDVTINPNNNYAGVFEDLATDASDE